MDTTGRPIPFTYRWTTSGSRVSTSPSRSSPKRRFNYVCAMVSPDRDMGDATMGEWPTLSASSRDHQERHGAEIEPCSGRVAADAQQLTQRLQQVASQPVSKSHGLSGANATVTRSRVRSPRTQSDSYSTQTPWSRFTALPAASAQFQQDLPDVALLLCTSPTHWLPSVPRSTSNRSVMWGEFRQQQSQTQPESQSQSRSQPPDDSSLAHTQLQSQEQTEIAACHFAPFDDGQLLAAPNRTTVYAMENQLSSMMRSPPHQETSEDMEIDELLDDVALDMLVTTIARETPRIEAAGSGWQPSVFNPARQHEEDDGENEEDNHPSEQDQFDDSESSSGEPSVPSMTPSTSSSERSALRGASRSESKGSKGKATSKRIRSACVIAGCDKRSRSLGLCIAHGGGRRCVVAGCDKSSQGGNLCIKHGGGKRCSVDGCEKAAQTNSLCKAHGGGPRCQVGNCQKSSQGGGFCRQHGGGKRCAFEGCMKGTQRGRFCALHGGARFCIIDGCQRNDRGGGYCAHHGGGRRCTMPDCPRPSRRNALCSTHLRLLDDGSHNREELNGSIDQDMMVSLATESSPLASYTHKDHPHSSQR